MASTSEQCSKSTPMDKESSSSESAFEIPPFKHAWVFGHNIEVPALNLTTNKYPQIFYTASHIGIIRSYEDNTMKELSGHRNKIVQTTTDKTGRWIVTADNGHDNAIIFWDSKTGAPVHTLFDVFPKGCDVIELSPCAKYLITINYSPEQLLYLWEWVFGREEPDGTICFDRNFGNIKTISFSPDVKECFIVTSGTNENGEFRSSLPDISDLWTKKPKGIRFTDSTFIDGTNSHLAVTATNVGLIIVWSDQLNDEKDFSCPMSIQKKGIYKVRLSQGSITKIVSSNKNVITADSQGSITIYDQDLKFLTYFENKNLGCITALHFDRSSQNEVANKLDTGSIKEEVTLQTRNEKGKLRQKMLLHTPVELMPVTTENILFSTRSGEVGYIYVSEEKVQYLLHPGPDITAMDSHPAMPYFCVGTNCAKLLLIDYLANEILIERIIESTKDKLKQNPDTQTNNPISCVKYSPNATWLACGLENGTLWMLHPVTITMDTDPYLNSKGAITSVSFSKDSIFMAVADSQMCVSLYIVKREISFLGKYRSHYKSINDLTFYSEGNNCQLYSIGEDRSLVEYDLTKDMKIAIKCIYRIDQCGKPRCALPYPSMKSSILLCNSQGKFRVIDTESKHCIKTTQGPILPSPVHLIKVIPSNSKNTSTYFAYGAGKYIGLQKMPLDGNPYKTISVLGSATDIKEICCSYDGSFIFTINNNDKCIHVWKIFKESVDILEKLGGPGLEPFYCMLDGGKHGYLMNDIKDFFYYCQIIHEGEHIIQERPIYNSLPLCELGDFMRALGFYPSDYDVTNMLHELGYDSDSHKTTSTYRIPFEELVKLYINHRSTQGITEKMLRDAFNTFAIEDDSTTAQSCHTISRKKFLAILEGTGEMFNITETMNYLNVLLSHSKDNMDYLSEIQSIPHKISYKFIRDELLGTQRTRTKGTKKKLETHKVTFPNV